MPYTRLKNDIKMAYLYPRLDSNVSVQLNHLLKAPFCVHPDTGKICVPIDPNLVEKFDPSDVPILNSVFDSKSGGPALSPYITIFENFVTSLEIGRRKALDAVKESKQKSLSF